MMRAAFLAHGWLPAVLPGDAVRMRVSDARLAYTLRAAGAHLVDQHADVEIGPLDHLSGEAPVAIVCVGSRGTDQRGRVRQIVGRLAANTAVRRRSAETAAALRRRGFDWVQVVRWDRDQPIGMAGGPRSSPVRLAERFPRHALIVAGHGTPAPTVLDGALADVAQRTGLRLRVVRPIVSSGTLIVLADRHVLRVAIGPASALVDRQADVLVALHARPAAAIAWRVPTLFATGTAGLADWSLESRLSGVHPPPMMPAHLFDACLEFLAELHRLGSDAPGAPLVSRVDLLDADARASLPPGTFDALRDLANDLDDELRRLPRGFSHGDFSTQNLLVSRDRLAGVIDWAQGDAAGLPMLDALNLQLLDATQPDVYEWGLAISRYLLPLARGGGNEATRRYARAIGQDFSPRQLESLVRAYWLERVSHQLATYVDRVRDPVWVERNITAVLPAARSVRR